MKQFTSFDLASDYFTANPATCVCIVYDTINYNVMETCDPLTPPVENAVTGKYSANAAIYAQLALLDRKSIRALRENDTTLINQYETAAAALRTQLIQ